MVVSGLPIRNDIQHAGEIASMSLEVSLLLLKTRQENLDSLGVGVCQIIQGPPPSLDAPEGPGWSPLWSCVRRGRRL